MPASPTFYLQQLIPCHLRQVDYTPPENDPEGSVSIFTRSDNGEYQYCKADFRRFDEPSLTQQLIDAGVRKTGASFTSFSQVQ